MPLVYFNTSHVTVYQFPNIFPIGRHINFNTSHVTVYQLAHGGYNAACLFQYISCYCLSYTQAVRNAVDRNFNTSHVTVYPRPHTTVLRYTVISIHLMLLFITARHNIYEQPHIISIHLMLLFINLNRWENNVFDYFNTSHVTVYLLADSFVISINHISIHLMLLFIMGLLLFYELTPNFNTSHVTVYR